MAIRTNAVYNNAAFADVANNIAKIFAPPSGADASGYANAAAKRAEAARLQEAFDTITNPATTRDIVDRFGVGAGLYNPGSSYYSVDQSNATSRANNAADNERALHQTAIQPLGLNQTQTLGDELAARFGQPSQRSGIVELDQGKAYMGLPGYEGETVFGPKKPMTAEEVRGGIIQNMSPELQQAIGFGSTPVETIVGPDGKPVVTTRDQALGKAPFAPAGADKNKTNVIATLPDGRKIPAFQQPDGSFADAQTGQKLPEGITITEVPRPQGSNADLDLGKPVKNQIEKQFLDIATTRSLGQAALKEIEAHPASQGMVGALRGTVQDVIQTGGELGKFFGGAIDQAQKDIKAGLLPPEFANEIYDPSIPAIKTLGNLLVAQYARVMMPGDRVSQQFINDTKEALGLDGWLANQARAGAAIRSILTQIDQQEKILQKAYTEGPLSITGQTAPARTSPTLGVGDMLQDVMKASGLNEQEAQEAFAARPAGTPQGAQYSKKLKAWVVKDANSPSGWSRVVGN